MGGTRPPNPGSAEARAGGCICPVLDNNHGRTAPFGDDGWWIHSGCPLHALGEPVVFAKPDGCTCESPNTLDSACPVHGGLYKRIADAAARMKGGGGDVPPEK